jgi:hypothetical protein
VPKKRHEQHELFEHIGIWRSAVIESNRIEQVGFLSIGKDSNFFGAGACRMRNDAHWGPIATVWVFRNETDISAAPNELTDPEDSLP